MYRWERQWQPWRGARISCLALRYMLPSPPSARRGCGNVLTMSLVPSQGYCAPGHSGPFCELCIYATDYFSSAAAQCVACPKEATVAIFVGGSIAAALLLLGLLHLVCQNTPTMLTPAKRTIFRILQKGNSLVIMPKLKIIIAFYQSVQSIPTIYGVSLPRQYYLWMRAFDWLELDWSSLVVPGACLGYSFVWRLLISALAPVLLMAVLSLVGTATQLLRRPNERLATGELQKRSVAQALVNTLPAVLFLAFLLTISVSASIFASWSCISIEYDSNEKQSISFLRRDLSVQCSSDEHTLISNVAYGMVALWPVGMPTLFFVVLMGARKSLLRRRASKLTRATAFLHQEYRKGCYWWEPLFLLQRLTISGFLQFIPYQFIRLLAALLITIMYMALLLIIKPFRQRDLNLLGAIGAQFALACTFIGAICLSIYNNLELEGGTALALRFTGFASAMDLVNLIIGFNISVVVIFLGVTLLQAAKQTDTPQLRLVKTNKSPDLGLHKGCKWHLFLSHIWSSGQDQAREKSYLGRRLCCLRHRASPLTSPRAASGCVRSQILNGRCSSCSPAFASFWMSTTWRAST